uniref:FG-GAP repeat protein n=1 Tax=Promineifilum sp. TaxID=2664178 RepID=UPI0035B30345
MHRSRLLRSLFLLFGLLVPALGLGAAATLTFHQSAALHAGDPESRATFGGAIAFKEDASGVATAFIGAPRWSGDGRLNQGAAYVFTRGASGWAQTQRLVANPPEIGGTFGNSIALDLDTPGGPTAVIGSFYANANPSIPGDHTGESGAAFVFVRTGGVWVQQARLQAPQQLPAARFGASVAIDGDTLVVGAPNSDPGEEAVYVWTRSGATWTLQGKLLGNQPDVSFGGPVAIQGDTILVGATGQTVDGDAAQGAVHVFTRAGGVWSAAGRFSPADAGPDARFGSGIAFDGNTALIGAYGPGVAYVYSRAGGVWTQGPKLAPPNYDNLPINVNAVALHGDLAAIGSYDFRVNDDPDVAGGAYVFQRAGGTWSPVELLMPGDTDYQDDAGVPLAIQGNTILVS